MTLREYVRRRNGVALGGNGSMSNMLQRSFGASSFAGFWRYWNPIFSYFLLNYIYAPLRPAIPHWAAVILTFLFCGALHDAVTLLVRGSTAFLFTTAFFGFALLILATEALRIRARGKSFAGRAALNVALLATAIGAALSIRELWSGWPTIVLG